MPAVGTAQIPALSEDGHTTGGNPNIMTRSRPKHCKQHEQCVAEIITQLEADHTPYGQFHWPTLKEEFLKEICQAYTKLILTQSTIASEDVLKQSV